MALANDTFTRSVSPGFGTADTGQAWTLNSTTYLSVDGAKAARISLLEGSPEAIDAGLEKTRADTLPKVRAISGNVGAIGLADRDTGRTSMITLWDSGDSMRASSNQADQLRQQTADMSDQKIANVALYDVSMAQTVAGARA